MKSENREKCSLCECIILQVIFLNKYKHKSCTRAGVKRVAHGGSVICRERYWFDYRRKTASLEVLKDEQCFAPLPLFNFFALQTANKGYVRCWYLLL